MESSKVIITNAHAYVGTWVAERVNAVYRPGDTTIGLVDAEQGLIAGVLYQNFNKVNISAHIAAVPGARWLTKSFLFAIFDYPFNELGVKRITGFVPAWNKQAQRFDEHLGFVREATLEDVLPEGDLIVYRMKRQECRWLTFKENLDGIRV